MCQVNNGLKHDKSMLKYKIMKELKFLKKYSESFGKPMLRAIKNYSMIKNGDRIAVGLSGGKDSIALLYLLAWLQKFSHLEFDLSAIHINTFGNHDNQIIQKLCEDLNIKLFEEHLQRPDDLPPKSICSVCARLKRGAMRNICEANKISTLAFGHHATDAAETLLMNMLINKKLGSFCPVVSIPDSDIKIIRPMIYLTENKIINLNKEFDLPVAEHHCPYEDKNQRSKYKSLLMSISENSGIPDSELQIVSALENIDEANRYSNVAAILSH